MLYNGRKSHYLCDQQARASSFQYKSAYAIKRIDATTRGLSKGVGNVFQSAQRLSQCVSDRVA
jgi:hypothetical protein